MTSNLTQFIKHIINSKILIFGFLIYFLFNISALTNHFLDFFFFGSSIHHCCQGLDFYQIPNGAYAFINGGNLDGTLPEGVIQYSKNYATNFNVYHPLLTIILGGLLILVDPEISIKAWTITKIFITLGSVYYIYKNFKDNEYLNYALFIFLIFFSQYNEIKISQFQFLFNIFILYFLINLVKNKSEIEGGFLYFLTLIAKPVSLLFFPILIMKKKKNVAVIGIFIFAASTLIFNFLGVGNYYTNNVYYHVIHPIATKGIDFLSLDALLRNGFGVSPETVKYIKILTLIFIYAISFDKKIKIEKSIFLLTIYFLLFYDLVFQYHFSILGPVLAICLLTLNEFQSKISRIFILIISLPNTFFIFRIFNFGIMDKNVLGVDPTLETWRLVSLFQILPILILAAIVLFPDIKRYAKNFIKL
jgi:hypothetical protein